MTPLITDPARATPLISSVLYLWNSSLCLGNLNPRVELDGSSDILPGMDYSGLADMLSTASSRSTNPSTLSIHPGESVSMSEIVNKRPGVHPDDFALVENDVTIRDASSWPIRTQAFC